MIEGLSKNLICIYEYEIAHGNEVARIDKEAWTNCPLMVVFKEHLHVKGTPIEKSLSNTVQYWENKDTHYELQAGYSCTETRHAIAGPIH